MNHTNMEEVEREQYKPASLQQQHGVHEFSGPHRPLEMRPSKVYTVCCYILGLLIHMLKLALTGE